jgi:DNA mismatch endonuclease (patch repair protein)
MDTFSKKRRSQVMASIRSKNTSLELMFLKRVSHVLYPKGYRYKKHYSKLPGCPDIVFVSKKLAIFIDGDFWHGYKFKIMKKRLPKKYWRSKIEGNINRDRKVNKHLRKNGWQILRLWEHEIKKEPDRCVKRIEGLLVGQ